MTESSAGWCADESYVTTGGRAGKDNVLCKTFDCSGKTREQIAAEIVENARAAKCWQACVENGWTIHQSRDKFWCAGLKNSGIVTGPFPTPELAVENALAALRLKGAGS